MQQLLHHFIFAVHLHYCFGTQSCHSDVLQPQAPPGLAGKHCLWDLLCCVSLVYLDCMTRGPVMPCLRLVKPLVHKRLHQRKQANGAQLDAALYQLDL